MDTGETTGEDWHLRGSARTGTPHRHAVWLNAFHREAVAFNGLYVDYDLGSVPLAEIFDASRDRLTKRTVAVGYGISTSV